jgi:hypothetical protein
MARILVGCEWTGTVRRAFRARGHEAWSCDLLPPEDNSPFHLLGDVRQYLADGWAMALFFPPCTYLCNSGARWWKQRQQEQAAALALVQTLLNAPIPRIALENPEGCIGTRIRKADQLIHPWEYGEPYEKKTCLWLRGLPRLQPTKLMWPREQRIWRMPASAQRSQERSRTYPGIATAMAAQWGCLV